MCWFSMFVRLASLRGDALLCSPAAGALASHARILALLVGILAQDCSWIASYCRTLGDGSARWVVGRAARCRMLEAWCGQSGR